MKATEVTAGLAESNGSLLPGLWRDSLHVTCPVFSTGSIRHSQNDHLANSTNSQKNLHRLFHYNRIAHTHPFNGSFSGTTRVSRYQEGTTNLDFTEATDSEWQWHQLGRMQVCTSLQTVNHTNTSPLNILQTGCPSCRPTNSVKALKA